jgi:cellulose synthase/poly-beta-1,6-N-acetylglucosamine synthase-like glycosyltransferase
VTSPDLPLVTVLVPCRNEARYITGCLESILASSYPADRLEVLVLDGMSDDGTQAAVEAVARRAATVRLVPNPGRVVPTGLNLGIRGARGEVIVRMDAHNEYPPDYIGRLVWWLGETGADNVGGACVTRPANDSAVARAIAVALAHPFGVGNAHFRLGASSLRTVDTVPFGCFRRALFDRVGLFDEELVRNQDDEMNFRITRAGGRILLVPDVVSYYYARPSWGKLATMYYQYGFYKPLVALKVGRVMTLRQTLPVLFTVALLAGALLAIPLPVVRGAWLALLVTYGAAAALATAIARAGLDLRSALGLWLTFPILHLSYGWGYLHGLVALLGRRWGRQWTAPVSSSR